VSPRGHTPFFPCDRRRRIGLCLGKGEATWEHAQVVDPSALGSMGAPERLDDPINTPMESHNDRHKEEHKERVSCASMGCVCPRDMTDAPINRHVSWTDAPHTWAGNPFLVLFLVSIVVTLHRCVDGVIQPLWCTHASKCRWVHYLGVLPSCLALAQTQPNSSLSIAREEGCVPPWGRTSPSCPKVLLPTPIIQVLTQLLVSPLCSSSVPLSNIPKQRVRSVSVPYMHIDGSQNAHI
jgi:hypothetical protein